MLLSRADKNAVRAAATAVWQFVCRFELCVLLLTYVPLLPVLPGLNPQRCKSLKVTGHHRAGSETTWRQALKLFGECEGRGNDQRARDQAASVVFLQGTAGAGGLDL